jgi:maleylpyruvate isomerase
MYASPAQRSEEIERGSRLEPGELRVLTHESATALADDLAGLTAAQLDNTVITAQGRSIAASQIPWLRCREVGVHAVDLDAGVTFADLPDEFLAALVHDVIVKRTAAGELPAIAAWLTGRARADGPIGAWL